MDRGHHVTVVSLEGSRDMYKGDTDGITVIKLSKTGIFSTRAFKELSVQNDCIVWSSSSMTPFLDNWLRKLNRPIILLFTGPFYTVENIVRAQMGGVPLGQLLTLYKYAFVPMSLTVSLVNKPFISSAVVLSGKNAKLLVDCGSCASKVSVIPPGHDGGVSQIPTVEARHDLTLPKESKIVTYLGSLYQIRGVDCLLNAFTGVCKATKDVSLLILARTDQNKEIIKLKEKLSRLGIADRTTIISGFLHREKVKMYLAASDVVALPFILVPSDMPLGALEAMSFGKPVITTDIDGMPEMVAERGLVVAPADRRALEQAICTLTQDECLYKSLKACCVDHMSTYPGWEATADKFEAIIR